MKSSTRAVRSHPIYQALVQVGRRRGFCVLGFGRVERVAVDCIVCLLVYLCLAERAGGVYCLPLSVDASRFLVAVDVVHGNTHNEKQNIL